MLVKWNLPWNGVKLFVNATYISTFNMPVQQQIHFVGCHFWRLTEMFSFILQMKLWATFVSPTKYLAGVSKWRICRSIFISLLALWRLSNIMAHKVILIKEMLNFLYPKQMNFICWDEYSHFHPIASNKTLEIIIDV